MSDNRPRNAALALAALVLTIGCVSLATVQGGDDAKPNQAPGQARPSSLKTLKPGDYVRIEVLEALPGRPLSGIWRVRPDGTLGLDFYGDLPVAGLNRIEVKKAVVLQLRRFLIDDCLGLERPDPDDDTKVIAIAPEDSDRVFIDDDITPAEGQAALAAQRQAPAHRALFPDPVDKVEGWKFPPGGRADETLLMAAEHLGRERDALQADSSRISTYLKALSKPEKDDFVRAILQGQANDWIDAADALGKEGLAVRRALDSYLKNRNIFMRQHVHLLLDSR